MCSAGFWARNATNPDIKYVVTAGHCFLNAPDNLNFYNHRPWNSQDWKRKGSNFVGKAEKYFIEPFDADLIFVEVDDILVPSVGAHLCKSGYVTHVSCGYIKSFNGFFIYEFSFGRKFIFDTSESRGGDSGGTAFSYQNLSRVSLIGVHSASGFDISVTTPLRTLLDNFEIEPYLLKFLD
ncbi:trypsin-like cysteine/serine peptidase domain-containing protein [Gigaspora rosea]|uniref:Trypsin-like cysteine/serine peptidase domain-containing protein n=1 Tax=Gigaspora rosea TaxID=44941 RepID=A0A397V8Z9_9GLOM|nr:trypsin-like cysteine/serine peptidase domain-containing protein [Gigaspora rosea]